MEKYFVYLPMVDYSAGCMDHGVLAEAETADEAIETGSMGRTLGFPDTSPAAAVKIPEHLAWLPDEEKLEYYMGLAQALGEKAFYREVMKVRGYQPAPHPGARYFISGVEVSEEEWDKRQKST